MSRILVVSAGPFTGQIGGGQSYVQDLVTDLRRRGQEVIVLEPVRCEAQGDPALKEVSWSGVTVWQVRLPLPGETLEDLYTELSPQRVGLFVDLLKEFRPHAVHINGLMPTMVTACKTLAIRHLVVAHHPGEVCPKGDLLTAEDTICTITPSPKACGRCVLRCKKVGRGAGKLLASAPFPVLRGLGRRLARKNPLGYVGRVLYIPWLVEQRLRGLAAYLREAETFVAPSQAISLALIRSGARRERVHVIHHGITPLRKIPIEGLDFRPLRFGYVGRIDHAKGLHVLLKAMQIADVGTKAELHVYGAATNARDKAEWDSVLRQIGSPSWLKLKGPFPREKIEDVLRGIDVLVLPAINLEVFGLVVAEALSAGRPVLTTRCGGPAEQVVDGENGWLVAPNNVFELAAKLKEITESPELVRNAALTAGKSVKTHDRYIGEIESLLLGKH